MEKKRMVVQNIMLNFLHLCSIIKQDRNDMIHHTKSGYIGTLYKPSLQYKLQTSSKIPKLSITIYGGFTMKKKQVVKEIIGWVKYIAVAFALAVIINNTLIVNAEVISASMESTIMTDSRILGSRLAYVISAPERFDIIVFKFPDDETSKPFVKRIIGLPNEKVEIRDGKVYIDDSEIPLDDSFINEETWGNYGPFVVPDDSYFVLGDNRNNSYDSKNWVNKFVARDKILGKVLVEYFPTPKLLS